MKIIPRDRESDIFGAAFTYAPSYDGPELWTLIEGVLVPGKPTAEHLEIARARRQYDVGVKTLQAYGKATINGMVYSAGGDPREFASTIMGLGAPARSVITAWNLARLSRGERTAHLYLKDRQAVLDAYAEGALVDLLEVASR